VSDAYTAPTYVIAAFNYFISQIIIGWVVLVSCSSLCRCFIVIELSFLNTSNRKYEFFSSLYNLYASNFDEQVAEIFQYKFGLCRIDFKLKQNLSELL
jgi:hypothetical protein